MAYCSVTHDSLEEYFDDSCFVCAGDESDKAFDDNFNSCVDGKVVQSTYVQGDGYVYKSIVINDKQYIAGINYNELRSRIKQVGSSVSLDSYQKLYKKMVVDVLDTYKILIIFGIAAFVMALLLAIYISSIILHMRAVSIATGRKVTISGSMSKICKRAGNSDRRIFRAYRECRGIAHKMPMSLKYVIYGLLNILCMSYMVYALWDRKGVYVLRIRSDMDIICTAVIFVLANVYVISKLVRDSSIDKNILIETAKISDVKHQIEVPAGIRYDKERIIGLINDISNRFDKAVDASVRNERMKIELITNVSHDIKTPLTSVINYVDLIRRENIPDEKIKGYVDILDQKSQRLKVLIEDLVEASKASSGNIELDIEPLNLNELVSQVSGEFEERFIKADLEQVLQVPDEDIVIMADGRRVFRVLENLFGNAVKYAACGTRVYAQLSTSDGKAEFVIKNTSRDKLNITPEELTERFVRGDSSRTTEGSGLGLSIARSLTELMNGIFQIELDADLFKVRVSFECRDKE